MTTKLPAPDIMDMMYVVTMPDGSRWEVPVELIAKNRAAEYLDEFGYDLELSLNTDTIPLFQQCPEQVMEWAQNNMNWSEVMNVARRISDPIAPDYKDGWVNGEVTLERRK